MLDFVKNILSLGTYVPFADEISLRIHSSSSSNLYELTNSYCTGVPSNRFPWRT